MINRLRASCTTLLLLIGINIFSQSSDTLVNHTPPRVVFYLTGGGGGLNELVNNDILLPEAIRKERVLHDPYKTTVQQLTDDPFRHVAFWGRLEATTKLFHQNTLSLGLIAEHRGESFGVYSIRNLPVLPYLIIDINDSISIFSRKYSLKAKTGFLERVTLDAGLLFYNLDAQGSLISLRGKKYAVEFDVLGDLIAGIGLGIDDAITLRFKRYGLHHTLALSFMKLTRNPTLAGFSNPVIPSLTFHFNRHIFHLDAQVAYRTGQPYIPIPNYPVISTRERLGLKAGISLNRSTDAASRSVALEARYYGRFFNIDNYNPVRPYRDHSKPIHGNYTGSHLYPLKNYFYDFSQLPVFTEYGIREIGAFSLVSRAERKIWRPFWYTAKLDANLIFAEGSKPFLYPFYTAGVSVHFSSKVRLDLVATNKMMNLDVHYHTFYLTRYPYFGVFFCTKV